MAETGPATTLYAVHRQFCFDRLWREKLVQAYHLVVPEPVGSGSELLAGTVIDETSRDLRPCVLGKAEGAGDRRQPSGSVGRVCPESGLGGATSVAVLDEGYSGASLARPGLDRLRDAAAEGQMETVVVLSPDRLSRKYAYQILLLEELDRQGTEVAFVHSPPAKTPEEQLLLQVQGMIAEYERAQIVERTRRGKRHQARQGSVNVLSGAPYGYRYVKKTDASSAYYEVLEGCSAQGVRSVHAATGKHRIGHAHSE